MNRLLQRFVGDATSASPSQQQQRAAEGAQWSPQAPPYPHPHHHQQQLYAPHEHAATNNSFGLEEIPLSSPVGSSRPPAGAPPPRDLFSHQQEVAADAFFQSEMLGPPSRPPSADLFSEPPRSSTSSAHSSSFQHFFSGEASVAAADPFASAPTSSHSGLEAPEDQRTLSTTGSVSDLFASLPQSTTPSVDGFQQHQPFQQQQQQESAAFGASTTSANLFANTHPPSQSGTSFYDSFAQQQPEQPGDNFWATADELFVSPDTSALTPTAFQSGFGGDDSSLSDTTSRSFHSNSGGEQLTRELPASSTPVASAARDEISTAADLFANLPEPTASSHSSSGFDQPHFRNDVTEASVDPFASSATDGFPTDATTFEQPDSAEYPYQQQQYDQQHQQYDYYQQYDQQYEEQQTPYEQQPPYEQQQPYDHPQPYEQQQPYDHSHQQLYDHQQQQQSFDQQYDPQYYFSDQETAAASLFESSAPSIAADHADPFAAADAEANGSERTPADPFSQPSHQPSSSAFQATTLGDAVAVATAVETSGSTVPSPTHVNDFFSEAPPSASSLFGSQPSEGAFDAAVKLQSPVWQPSPSKAAQTASSADSFSFVDSRIELISKPPAVSFSLTRSNEHIGLDLKEQNPVADDDDNDDDVAAVARSLTNTTLDDSTTLVAMYKHMSQRLEGEKNELLKVLADQADQFYQMQEYIASLEQELAGYRSLGQRSSQ